MTFLHPILLGIGAACVAIPIVIHLLMRRRRKPVRWAAMRFLLEAAKQRQRRVRLEQLLLLAARCLLLALIALAVARPMFGSAGALGSGSREVYLLLDTSLASAARGAEGTTDLEGSIERALELLAQLDGTRGDRAALITIGGPAEALVLPATSDLALLERRLRSLHPTDSRMDLPGGLALVPPPEPERDAKAPMVAVFSAFREGSIGRAPALGVLAGGRLIASTPAEEPLENIGLEGLHLLRPVVVTDSREGLAVGAAQVRVHLVRSGEGLDRATPTTVRVLALHEGSPREIGSAVVRWTPGQTEAQTTVDIDLAELGTLGRLVLRAEIDRDANERDNAAWAVLEVRDRLRVAVLGTRRFGSRPRITEFSPSDWLSLALEPIGETNSRQRGAQIEVTVLDAARIETGALAGFDAVLVAEPGRVQSAGWESLGAFRTRGGAVVLTASPTPGAQLWTEGATAALGLDWIIEREPVAIEEGRLIAPPIERDDLLWFLRSELAALAEMVTIERTLEVEVGETGGVLLTTADNQPVLVASGVRDDSGSAAGQVVLLTTAIDLSWTDLPARPLMVPLVQEIVRSSVGRGGSQRVVTAGAQGVVPRGAVEVVDRLSAEGRVVPVDPSTGRTRAPLRLGGVYAARNAGGVEVGTVTVQPAAEAGRAAPGSRERVGAWLGAAVGGGAVGGGGSERSGGGFAWLDTEVLEAGSSQGSRTPDHPGPGLLLLTAALVVACFELWLARRVSHAVRAPEGRQRPGGRDARPTGVGVVGQTGAVGQRGASA